MPTISSHACVNNYKGLIWSGEMTDSQLKSAIEGVVIKWVVQVEEVMKEDSDNLPEQHPTPANELNFWKKRKKNLSHIAKQLKDKKVIILN